MTFDLLILILLAVFAVVGLWTGAARQLGHWVGLAAAWFSSRPLAALAGPPLGSRLGLPEVATTFVCGAVIFILVYAIVARLVRLALAAVFPEGEKGAFNRLVGALLGAAKAALVLYLLLSALVLFEDPIARAWPAYRQQASSSLALGVVKRHNPLEPLFDRARSKVHADLGAATAKTARADAGMLDGLLPAFMPPDLPPEN